MNQSLQYRPLVKKAYWIGFSTLIIAELIVLRLNIYEIMVEPWYRGMIKLVLASTLILSLFFRLVVFIRPRVFSTYSLGEDQLLIQRGKKQIQLDFAQVESLVLSRFSPRFFGGFWIHMKTGQKFFISSLLESADQVFTQLTRVREDLISSEKRERFNNLLLWAKQTWKRVIPRLKKPQWLLLKYLIFPLLMALGLRWQLMARQEDIHNTPSYLNLFFGAELFILVWFALLNFIEEKLLFSHYCKEGGVAPQFEKRVFLIINVIFYLIPLLGLLIFSSL